jgi:hypothetical protein
MEAMEHTSGEKPEYPLQMADGVPAVEEHGRAVTANPRAAAWYRQAQLAVDCPRVTRALELALTADPAFGLAIADLGAITGRPSEEPKGRQMTWERHHIEVVRAASAGDAIRAADLLREHLASVGCDPLAARIAAHLRPSMPGMTDRLPSCHPSAWPC